MDDLKAKVKSLRLNPFKKTPAAFKGTGRVLGGGEVCVLCSSSQSPLILCFEYFAAKLQFILL